MAGLRLEPQAGFRIQTKHFPAIAWCRMDVHTTNERETDIKRPKYFLSSSAYCCEFDDGAVILDMRAGVYLGIDAKYLRDLRNCIGNWPNNVGYDPAAGCADDESLQTLIVDLIGRRILTTAPTQPNAPELEYPTATLTNMYWSRASDRIPLSHMVKFFASLARVALHRKGPRLAAVLAWIRRRQSTLSHLGSSRSPDRKQELLTSFLRLRVWCYTAYRRCLFDSMVLSVFLTKNEVPCTLVIGVATKPFVAHSWVQIGEWVLNDTVEYVQMFTPILAVGEAR